MTSIHVLRPAQLLICICGSGRGRLAAWYGRRSGRSLLRPETILPAMVHRQVSNGFRRRGCRIWSESVKSPSKNVCKRWCISITSGANPSNNPHVAAATQRRRFRENDVFFSGRRQILEIAASHFASVSTSLHNFYALEPRPSIADTMTRQLSPLVCDGSHR